MAKEQAQRKKIRLKVESFMVASFENCFLVVFFNADSEGKLS